eukprot:gene4843-7476_t
MNEWLQERYPHLHAAICHAKGGGDGAAEHASLLREVESDAREKLRTGQSTAADAGGVSIGAFVTPGSFGPTHRATHRGRPCLAQRYSSCSPATDPSEVHATAISRLLADARRLVGLSHAHVLRVLQVLSGPQSEAPGATSGDDEPAQPSAEGGGEVGGVWVVTEGYRCRLGDLLRAKAGAKVRVTLGEMAGMAGDVAAGLAYLHSNRVVHNDLSLANVVVCVGRHSPCCGPAPDADGGSFLPEDPTASFFSENPARFTCKITGLALAAFPAPPRPDAHFLPGRKAAGAGAAVVAWKQHHAASHAAPEVLSSGRLSEESDVWALGVTALEILTYGMTPPYPHVPTGDIRPRVAGGLVPARPKGSPASFWDEVVARCFLAPGHRVSAGAFAAAACEFRTGGAAAGRPLTPPGVFSADPTRDCCCVSSGFLGASRRPVVESNNRCSSAVDRSTLSMAPSSDSHTRSCEGGSRTLPFLHRPLPSAGSAPQPPPGWEGADRPVGIGGDGVSLPGDCFGFDAAASAAASKGEVERPPPSVRSGVELPGGGCPGLPRQSGACRLVGIGGVAVPLPGDCFGFEAVASAAATSGKVERQLLAGGGAGGEGGAFGGCASVLRLAGAAGAEAEGVLRWLGTAVRGLSFEGLDLSAVRLPRGAAAVRCGSGDFRLVRRGSSPVGRRSGEYDGFGTETGSPPAVGGRSGKYDGFGADNAASSEVD